MLVGAEVEGEVLEDKTSRASDSNSRGDGGGRIVCSYCQGRKVVGFSMP